MYYIDSHCHLDLLPNIQKEADKQDGLPIKTITVTNSPLFFEANHLLFKDCQNIRIALGLHPELVANYQSNIDVFQTHISKTRYIGEVGIDGSREHSSTFDLQVEIFNLLIELVKSEGNKIISAHSRRAGRETLEVLRNKLSGSNCKIILHWFTGTPNELKFAIDLGCYFSINHKMFESQRSRDNIRLIPKERLLTETDAPFTFDRKIKDRLTSLEISVTELAKLNRAETLTMKEQIFSNFRKLIS
jgi:TatD DNase family protein